VRAGFGLLEEWEVWGETFLLMTRAALHLLRCAVWVLAYELALRLWAHWLLALPVAFRLFTNRFTYRSRRFAARQTVRLVAYHNALRTLRVAASLARTLVLAHRLLTFDIAESVGWLSAGSVALGWLAYRLTNSRALWIIALPRALGTALLEERCENEWH
jgi:hypothetical protein